MRSATRRAGSAAIVLSAALLLAACDTGTGSGAGSANAAPAASPASTAGAGSTQKASGAQSPAVASASAPAAECTNLTATDEVKAAVTHAYGAETQKTHITARPGQFLYGQCKGVYYAATAFDLTAGATYEEKVGAQDDGSVRKYFVLAEGKPWAYLGSAGFPDTGGCLGKVPAPLARVWNNCR